ncbi:GNAT family N-acetyltransferase [uncultured Cellulomonas sp.]|uniref:GNAT family N-acetyltransferase n=1 Tax=uncultured Cellulomonas sp. TaxID=189682 RepID=UPI0028E8C261|nr:GNAT family N-acetyltransferase [uncultured Cellulomonas sp.]
MELPDVLELPGARVRALRTDDWVLDHALSRIPDVHRWTYYPAAIEPAEARERVARSLAQRADGRGARWAVERAGSAVGTIGIVLRVDGPYVYYALLPEGRGSGLATAAVRVVSDWVLAHWAADVRAVTMVGNLSSERVLERVSFRRAGVDVEPDGVSVTRWVRTHDTQPTVQ